MFDDTNSDHTDFETLVSFYLPQIDLTTTICERQIWKQKGKRVAVGSDEVIKSNPLDAIKYCDPIIFSNIFILLKCLPVSTATTERTFFSLKRVTYFRNSMKKVYYNYIYLFLFYYLNITLNKIV